MVTVTVNQNLNISFVKELKKGKNPTKRILVTVKVTPILSSS